MHYFGWAYMAWMVMTWLILVGLFITLIWSIVLTVSLRFEDRKSSGTMVKRDDASDGKNLDQHELEETGMTKAA